LILYIVTLKPENLKTIGLFPLGIVIFPGATLPLHIFEPRYRQLVANSLKNDTEFGINFVEGAKMHDVGCAVKISQVIEKYPDGRMDIAVTGTERYRLKNMRDGDAGYYEGDIYTFDDGDDEIDYALTQECFEMYNQIVKVVFGEHEILESLQETSGTKPSFFFAQKCGLTLTQKQELLEMTSENTRLEFLKKHMKEIVPKVKQVEYIENIIRSDGYFRPPTIE
jgi:ATP-dependent Lon protease